ncbi:MAG TPA: DHH family phosphoesterase, partial [Lachnospiraceae bacterium]|nr:DHH family phosphoesterase [Lachnospiraceae bacterium]
MNRKSKLTAMIKSYFRWPIWLALLLIAMNVSIYFIDDRAAIMMAVYVLLYIIIVLFLYHTKRVTIFGEIVRFAADYGQVQKQLLKELSLPYAILDMEGHLLWGNDEFIDIIMNERAARRSIMNIFPEITKDNLPNINNDTILHIAYNDKNYRLELRKTIANSFKDSADDEYGEEYERSNIDNSLIALYLYDETDIVAYLKEKQEQRLIVGLIYIDNYEEALESIDEVRRSLLVALVDRKINKYMQNIDSIIKKLEKDKYIIIFKQKYLTQLQTCRFSLLDEVKAINIGNDMAVTISIGLGVNAESYLTRYDYARVAIDLALGRGGDQAVVKDGEKIQYYGGKSMQVEKNTRVKARVKAHALKELVEAKDKVVIMGHSIGDVDSFGSAVGIYRIAKTLNKRAHIVINEVTTSVRPLIDRFLDNPDYEPDMILTGPQAIEIVDNNTLLVIVDVNRPNYTECKELLDLTKTIVILDHHRQSGEAVENAVLS